MAVPESITGAYAAYLAGIAVGFWRDKEDVCRNRSLERTFSPHMPEEKREEKWKGWKRAVRCAVSYADGD